jgi:regulator of protease activity HflC (stomatin/prohibitin superfamily)
MSLSPLEIILLGATLVSNGLNVFLVFRSKASGLSSEVIDNYARLETQLKEQKKELEDKLTAQAAAHTAEMNSMHAALGQKEATIALQEKLIADYKATIENRNPDLEKVLQQISDYMKANHELMQDIRKEILQSREISTANAEELHEQTTLLKDGKKVMLTGQLVPVPPEQPPQPNA